MTIQARRGIPSYDETEISVDAGLAIRSKLRQMLDREVFAGRIRYMEGPGFITRRFTIRGSKTEITNLKNKIRVLVHLHSRLGI